MNIFITLLENVIKSCTSPGSLSLNIRQAGDYPDLRYLDASRAGLVNNNDVSPLRMLIFLRLQHCNLTSVSGNQSSVVGLDKLTNLHALDLSHNQLTSFTFNIAHLSALTHLQSLWLNGNDILENNLRPAENFIFEKVSHVVEYNIKTLVHTYTQRQIQRFKR
jgi:Leucine-rich repeat (LRR) protein